MRIKKRCELCGEDYWTGNGKAKYCSDACRKETTRQRQKKWREEHPDYHKEYFKKHPEAAKRFKERHPNYGRDRSRKIRGSKEYHRECVVCGKRFDTWIPHKHTCSDECEYARKSKRIPYEQVIDTDITVKALYERDKGICHLCGKPCDYNDIDRERNAIGKNYPSIDHVYPLIRGGMHSWDNVRLAHVGCNASKRDKVI